MTVHHSRIAVPLGSPAEQPLAIEPYSERKSAIAAHMARLARESVREALADIATIRRQADRKFGRACARHTGKDKE